MDFTDYLILYKENEKPASTFFHRHVSKNGAKVFSYIAIKMGITPNQISLLSLFLFIFSCFLICLGDVSGLFFSVVLLQFAYICDCSDGVVARYTSSSSSFGAYLDVLIDRVAGYIFTLVISYVAFRDFGLISGCITLASLTLYYFYSLSATFRPYYFPSLKGFMKKNDNLSIVKKLVKLAYEFIDTGIFYFIIALSLISGVVVEVAVIYGFISLLLTAGNLYVLYNDK